VIFYITETSRPKEVFFIFWIPISFSGGEDADS